MSEQDLRLMISARIHAGELPCDPEYKTYARKGGTGVCSCCGLAIAAHEIQYELCFSCGRNFLTHINCYRIWQEQWTLPRSPD